MNLTNYHSHSFYCDGRTGMEDFARFARSKRFTSFGFSSHAPLPFPTAWTMEWDRMDDYLTEFARLKQKYSEWVELYIGLEIDYLNDLHNPASEYFHTLPLDYRIGSVHLLYDTQGEIVDSDVPAPAFCRMVEKHFRGDLDRVIHLYYERLMRMLELGGFDIVGHADKIHYNASAFRPGILDEPWYDDLVCACFREIARHGYQMEINTKAYRELGTFYPNERYFSYLRQLGIPVQVNSDAHYPDRINYGRKEALQALRRAGFKNVMEMHGGRWREREII